MKKTIKPTVVMESPMEDDDSLPHPPTANFLSAKAAALLKGLIAGKTTHKDAMAGAKLVESVTKIHSNKLKATVYQSKPMHRDLLKELSVKA